MSNQSNQSREDAKASRLAGLMEMDFSAAQSIDELWAPGGNHLASDEIKKLTHGNESFKKRLDQLNGRETSISLIEQYRALDTVGQQQFYEKLTPAERALIDRDVKKFLADADTQEQRDAKAAEEQAVADRAAAELAAANANRNEQLYPGVVKFGEDDYRLTINPGDGSNPEVFRGTSQQEVWKKLVDSKKNATAELRRRAKKAAITPELKEQFERMNWPPLLEYVELQPTEIFELTEQLKDPSTMLQAQRRLAKAALTKEEVERQNSETIRARIAEGRNTTTMWMKANNFYAESPENITALNEIFVKHDIFPTPFNLSLAFETLKNQGLYVEAPESEASAPIAAPAAAPSAPVATQPARVLRPVSSSTSGMSTTRMEMRSKPVAAPALTPEAYHAMPAQIMQTRYKKEPAFRAEVDALIASGKV